MATHKKWIVKAACVVVSVHGQERYLYQDSPLPDGVAKRDLTRLDNAGLIREIDVPDEPEIPDEPGDEPEIPDEPGDEPENPDEAKADEPDEKPKPAPARASRAKQAK